MSTENEGTAVPPAPSAPPPPADAPAASAPQGAHPGAASAAGDPYGPPASQAHHDAGESASAPDPSW
ncbi:protease, partial [Streptomyces werraensis]